ncbi:unnamed protein product [Rhizophagus irregularis]|nr:unnamed protein product [Rhizophagus irregularis]
MIIINEFPIMRSLEIEEWYYCNFIYKRSDYGEFFLKKKLLRYVTNLKDQTCCQIPKNHVTLWCHRRHGAASKLCNFVFWKFIW